MDLIKSSSVKLDRHSSIKRLWSIGRKQPAQQLFHHQLLGLDHDEWCHLPIEYSQSPDTLGPTVGLE